MPVCYPIDKVALHKEPDMEKIKQSFLDMMNHDKMKFLFFVMYAGAFGTFLLSIFMPFMVGEMIIGRGVSLFKLPGHTAFTLLFLSFALLSLYDFLIHNDKNTRLFIIFTGSVATLIFAYGVLFQRVGAPTSNIGLGQILAILMIILIWLLTFGNKFVKKQLVKYANVEEKIE